MRELLQGSGYSPLDISETVEKLRLLADDLEGLCNGTMPPIPEVSITRWLLARRAVPCLVGKVSGHPTVKGQTAATTEVFFLNQTVGLARTFNRWYSLGSAADEHREPY
jgi:hypothetical protein